jgi:hypothetical protein
LEKCCDACGDEEYYFRSDFPASEGDRASEASNAVDRKSMGHTVADLVVERSRLFVYFFSVFAVFRVAVIEKCCDACGGEEYYLRSDFPASEGDRYFRGIECR